MTNLRDYLPLKPVDLLLLLSLVEGERHGYGLVQDIAERTGDVVQLEPGNFYRIIKRLLARGMLAEAGHRPAADLGQERRRYYRITRLGQDVAAAEVRRLRSLLSSPAVARLERGAATA